MLEANFLARFNPQIGDEIIVDCGFYQHISLFAGRSNNINLITENQYGFGVHYRSLAQFLSRYPTNKILVHKNGLIPSQQARVIELANQLVGSPYNWLTFNCEHYARFLLTGKSESPQLNFWVGALSVGLLVNHLTKPEKKQKRKR